MPISINNNTNFILYNQPLGAYLDALASAQPTPGGGSAAALTGAQGVALLSMVCNLTLNNQRLTANAEAINKLLISLEQYRHHFLALAQEDANAFQTVIATYKLPKDTPEAVTIRTNAIQMALRSAAEIPFTLLESCAAILPLATTLETIGTTGAISDVVVGRNLIFASMLGAVANIEANLVMLTDSKFCHTKRLAINQILVHYHQNFLATWPKL